MAKLEFSGFDGLLDDLDNVPFDCTCSACGKTFQATQDELMQPTAVCPYCGASLVDD